MSQDSPPQHSTPYTRVGWVQLLHSRDLTYSETRSALSRVLPFESEWSQSTRAVLGLANVLDVFIVMSVALTDQEWYEKSLQIRNALTPDGEDVETLMVQWRACHIPRVDLTRELARRWFSNQPMMFLHSDEELCHRFVETLTRYYGI